MHLLLLIVILAPIRGEFVKNIIQFGSNEIGAFLRGRLFKSIFSSLKIFSCFFTPAPKICENYVTQFQITVNSVIYSLLYTFPPKNDTYLSPYLFHKLLFSDVPSNISYDNVNITQPFTLAILNDIHLDLKYETVIH